jgi:hypothetical protein
MMQRSLEPLGSGFRVLWPADRASQFARRQLPARLHNPGDRRDQIAHHPAVHIRI